MITIFLPGAIKIRSGLSQSADDKLHAISREI